MVWLPLASAGALPHPAVDASGARTAAAAVPTKPPCTMAAAATTRPAVAATDAKKRLNLNIR